MKRIKLFVLALMLSVSSLSMMVIPHAFAATKTWTGTAGDHKFSTAGNWSPSGAPSNGDTLVFDNTSVTDFAPDNDQTGASYVALSFPGTGTTGFHLSGNAFTLTGGITNASNAFSEIDNDVTISGNQTIDTGTSTGTVYLNGVVDGSGNIAKSGAGFLDLVGDNSGYTGTITASAGILVAQAANSFGTGGGAVSNDGSDIVLSGCSPFDLASDLTLTGASSDPNGTYVRPKLSINFGCSGGGVDESYGYPASTGNASLNGAVTLGSDITFAGFIQTTTITGALSGAHQITLLPGYEGKLVVSASSNTSSTANGTYSSPVLEKTLSDDQSAHSVLISGDTTLTLDGKRGDTTVATGATLKGTGSTGFLAVNTGGTVAPGHSPGCLTVGGNLTITGSYSAEIGGKTACTEYDQLKVTGTVDLTNGTLNVSFYNGFKPTTGQKYTIIDNDAADAVTGTFSGLAQGATITVGTYKMSISYTGGDGNDVVLTVTAGAPNTGFALPSNSPYVGVAVIFAAAGAIAFMARRSMHPATARRKR